MKDFVIDGLSLVHSAETTSRGPQSRVDTMARCLMPQHTNFYKYGKGNLSRQCNKWLICDEDYAENYGSGKML